MMTADFNQGNSLSAQPPTFSPPGVQVAGMGYASAEHTTEDESERHHKKMAFSSQTSFLRERPQREDERAVDKRQSPAPADMLIIN